MLPAILLASAILLSRPTPVEVVTPMPPTPVQAEGERILAYELHITNFGSTPFVLRSIEVSDQAGAPVRHFEGAELAKMLQIVGGSGDRLDPGKRLIAFVWITLPLNAAVPVALRHRLTFDVIDPTQNAQSVVDGITVSVQHRPVPRIRSPFVSGDWAFSDGPSNGSLHRRSVNALAGRMWISQRFAIDCVRVGPNRNSFHGSKDRNENFWAFGESVRAVADGEVTEVVDEYPDNHPGEPLQPVTVQNITGNHVIVRVGVGQYVLFAHLQSHSIRVRLHERVHRGEVIAKVGNSGNTTGPHLHFQVMNGNAAIAAEGIPYVFDEFTFVGHGSDFDQAHHPVVRRRLEMPLDDDVLRFP